MLSSLGSSVRFQSPLPLLLLESKSAVVAAEGAAPGIGPEPIVEVVAPGSCRIFLSLSSVLETLERMGGRNWAEVRR